MNPDINSREYVLMRADMERERAWAEERRMALHAKAVARRRKAKRGGRR